MGIGDGWMSPYLNARYADFLYLIGLVNEKQRDECLEMEATTHSLIKKGILQCIDVLEYRDWLFPEQHELWLLLQHCTLCLQPCRGQLKGVP